MHDGYMAGLSFLDTARGINPIVEKLPYNIQEQWISQGSRYKREHNVVYPPLLIFHRLCVPLCRDEE